MKKLLSILGSFTITATGFSTVIACNDPNKNTDKDLSSILFNQNITFGSKKDLTDFKNKLTADLRNQNSAISITDLDFLKISGGIETELKVDDLINGKIEIKIKSKGAKFTGEKLITVNWWETYDLATSLNDTYNIVSGKISQDFKIKLHKELQKQVSTINKYSVRILKEDGKDLANEDIKSTFKVIAQANEAGVTGEKLITINWTEEKDIAKLLGDTLIVAYPKYPVDFEIKLLNELKEQIPSLSNYYVHFFKGDKEIYELDCLDSQPMELKIKFEEKDHYYDEGIITVLWKEETNLDKLLEKSVSVGSPKDVAYFKLKLIRALQWKLPSITDEDIEIYKEDGKTDLAKSDLDTKEDVKVKIKAKGGYFTGEKIVSVSFTEVTSLSELWTKGHAIDVTSRKEVGSFKAKLIEELKKVIPTITVDNIKIINAEDKTELTNDADIKSEMKIVIEPNGDEFTYSIDFTIYWKVGIMF